MLKQPESMEECLYFTRRVVDSGSIIAWANRKVCPKCGKAKMGKPVAKGKVKIRATEYVCPECSFSEEKKEHEESLNLDVIYTCPFCSHKGETTIPYKRKTWQGVPSYIFVCDGCSKKVGITRKMKKKKKK